MTIKESTVIALHSELMTTSILSRAMHIYISLLSYVKKFIEYNCLFFKTNHYIDHNYILLIETIISKTILFQ